MTKSMIDVFIKECDECVLEFCVCSTSKGVVLLVDHKVLGFVCLSHAGQTNWL